MAQHKILDSTESEKDKLEGGKADDAKSLEFDSDELAKGIEVEKEHTDDENLAEEIAKDHLKEIPDYYTRLRKMEDEAKAELSDEEGEDIPESTEDVFLLLTLAAQQELKSLQGIKRKTAIGELSDAEGQWIAGQLGLLYNGIQDYGGYMPNTYVMTDPLTETSFNPRSLEEATQKLQEKRQLFKQTSKLNLTKNAIDWPWNKPNVPEEQVDETIEPTTRIEPPQFQTRKSPGVSGEPAEATPEQAELIQGLAASKTHID
ncbi:hypothetical protein LCGC14_3087880, partial [marine sediment metagenome]